MPFFRRRNSCRICRSWRWRNLKFTPISWHYSSCLSGFRRGVDEIWALVGYYASKSGNSLPTFRCNLSLPSSSVIWISWPLNMRPIGVDFWILNLTGFSVIGPVIKFHLDFLTLEYWTDTLYRNVERGITSLCCVLFQKIAELGSLFNCCR